MLNLKPGDRVTYHVNGRPSRVGFVEKVTAHHFTVKGSSTKYRLRNGMDIHAEAWFNAYWEKFQTSDEDAINRVRLLNNIQNFIGWKSLTDSELAQVAAIIDAARKRQEEAPDGTAL